MSENVAGCPDCQAPNHEYHSWEECVRRLRAKLGEANALLEAQARSDLEHNEAYALIANDLKTRAKAAELRAKEAEEQLAEEREAHQATLRALAEKTGCVQKGER